MASYRIFETDTFQRDLERIAHGGQRQIAEKLRKQVYPRLRLEPHFGPNIRKLKNWEPLTWRYRVGSWRLFYEINEKDRVIYMTAADHRSDAYK